MKFPNKRVLIIDDEPTVRQTISLMLESRGCEVVQFDSGPAAIESVSHSTSKFDCIILDYSMPEMNGIEVLQQLRMMQVKTPVIMCSGYSIVDDASKTGSFQPDEVLTKPFQFSELLERIDKVCGSE